MTTQELQYLVKVNDRDLSELRGRVRDTNKALGSETETASKRGSGALGKLGGAAKGLALGLGGAGAFALAGAARIGWDEFKQGQAVAAQTAAVLKSTGGAANVTAKDVTDLGTAIMKKSGMDDEAIKSGENLLLTFTGIRNEAGKGNDIFTQTTKTMADMSVALGQDTKSSAIQLGKALNDPIKGVTALQRVGVSFTTAQRDQIKAMVDSGHTMQAQKLILGELNKEFGGSAEAAGKTLPGQLNILKETFHNVAGDAVGAVVPALARVLKGLLDNLPAIEAFVGKIEQRVMPILRAWWGYMNADVIPIFKAVAQVIGGAIEKIVGVFESHKPQLLTIWKNLRVLLDAVSSVMKTVLIPILKFALETVLPKAIAIALPVLAKLSGAFRIVGDVIHGVGGALSAIGGALKAFGSGVKNIAGDIGKAFSSMGGAIVAGLKAPINGLISLLDAFHITIGKVSILGHTVFGGMDWHPFHIPLLAEGVTGFKGGLAIVGEQGPELVRLPRGSDVIPNAQSRRMIAGGAGSPSGGTLELHVHFEGPVIGTGLEDAARELARPMIEQLRRAGARGFDLSFAT